MEFCCSIKSFDYARPEKNGFNFHLVEISTAMRDIHKQATLSKSSLNRSQYSVLCNLADDAYRIISKGTVSNLGTYPVSNIIEVASAFQLPNENLFRSIARVFTENITEFNEECVNRVINAYTKTGRKFDQVLGIAAMEVFNRKEKFSPSELTDIFWNYNVFNLNDWIEDVGFYILYETNPDRYSETDLRKIYHSALAAGWDLSVEFKNRMQQTFSANQNRPPVKTSKFQKEVSQLLNAIGIETEEEFFIYEYHLDIKIKNKLIGIECDGDKFHYNKNGYPKANHTLKDRVFKKQGWDIYHVRTSDWDKLNKEQKKEFILKLSMKFE